MKYIETHATADVCIMLLGCKKDLEEYREVETEDARKVKRTEYWVLCNFIVFPLVCG